MITEIITTLGGFSILALALGFLLKTLFRQMLDKDIDQFKTELRHTSEKEITSLKAELQKSIDENSTRFSILHEERSKHLTDLFSKLTTLYSNSNIVHIISVTSGKEITKKDRYKEIIRNSYKNWEQLCETLNKCRLHLDKSLCKKLDKTISQCSAPIIKAKFIIDDFGFKDTQLDEIEKMYNKKVIKSSIKEIEQDFRMILGSEKKNKPE